MKAMGLKIKLLTAVCLLMTAMTAKGEFANETLNYVITYKWGAIHKETADATLRLTNHGSNYNLLLTAKTRRWADKFFTVRDTLSGVVSKKGLRPLRYVKSAHEGGKYSKDVITYSHNGKSTTGKCTRYRNKKGKVSTSGNTLTAAGDVYDMLSVFYYLRTLNYTTMAKGQTVKVTVFSGSKAETLTIKNLGLETITLRNKKRVHSYHIKFRFTTKGKKKSSDDMDAWLSADSRKIPLQLEGSLPLGKLKVYLK